MAGFYERKQSAAALWCQRLSVFLVPYLTFGILLHRFQKIQTPELFVIFAIGLAIAVLSLLLAFKAFADLWNRGHRGGKALVRGMFLTFLILLPFGFYAYLALALPLASDVSTNTFDPPAYLKAQELRLQQAEKGMNQLADYDDLYSENLVNAYPKLGPRRYPAGAERVFQAVKIILAANDWPITATSGAPEVNEDAEKAEATTQLADNAQSTAEEEAVVPEDISVEALVSSLIIGYKYDLVISIVSEDVNTLVELRSSSRWGAHDFGTNASIIERFLAQLDLALLGIAGEG